jgi:hypothetical protein
MTFGYVFILVLKMWKWKRTSWFVSTTIKSNYIPFFLFFHMSHIIVWLYKILYAHKIAIFTYFIVKSVRYSDCFKLNKIHLSRICIWYIWVCICFWFEKNGREQAGPLPPRSSLISSHFFFCLHKSHMVVFLDKNLYMHKIAIFGGPTYFNMFRIVE